MVSLRDQKTIQCRYPVKIFGGGWRYRLGIMCVFSHSVFMEHPPYSKCSWVLMCWWYLNPGEKGHWSAPWRTRIVRGRGVVLKTGIRIAWRACRHVSRLYPRRLTQCVCSEGWASAFLRQPPPLSCCFWSGSHHCWDQKRALAVRRLLGRHKGMRGEAKIMKVL